MSDCGTTHAGGRVYISATTANERLDEAGFSALTYIPIPGLGNHSDTGLTQSVSSYSAWGQQVACKRKSQATAQDFSLEFLALPSAGMEALEFAGAPGNSNCYAIKTAWPDGSVEYNRGVVTGPIWPKGSNEDFRLARFDVNTMQTPVLSFMPWPTMTGTLVDADDEEHVIGNVLVLASGQGVLLDADLVLDDDSTHPIFTA